MPKYLATVVELADGAVVPQMPPVELIPPEEGYILYHVQFADWLLICIWQKS